jgi:hypothetical protein
VSIDFPFYRRWHDVCGCYVNSGWNQLEKTVVRDRAPHDIKECQYIEAELVDDQRNHGQLFFANLNQDGQVVDPPREIGDLGHLLNSLIAKLQHSRQVSLNPEKVFQVQVWQTQATPQDSAVKNQLEGLFYDAYEYLRAELIKFNLEK